MIRRLAPALAAASVLALLLPAALHAVLTGDALSPARLQAQVGWTRQVAVAFAGAAVVAVAFQARRDPERARRQAAILATAGALLAVAAWLPFDDDALFESLQREYETEGGLQMVDSGTRLLAFRQWHGDQTTRFGPGPFWQMTRDEQAPVGLQLGPYPAERGDRWTVHVSVRGPFEPGYRSPDLRPPGHVACDVMTDEVASWASSRRGDGPLVEHSVHRLEWVCTVQDGEDVTFGIDLHRAGGNVSVLAATYPTFRLHFLQTLDDGLIRVGAALGVGGAALLVAGARRPLAKSYGRDHAAAATALVALAGTWMLMLWGTLLFVVDAPLGADVEIPIIAGLWTLFALATLLLGLGAAWHWRYRPEGPRALDLSRLAALAATITLPLGPFFPLGYATESFALALGHMVVGVGVAGLAVRGWWRPLQAGGWPGRPSSRP